MTDEIVRLSTEGPVAVLTMDRPPVNALNDAMYLALSRELDRLETRSDVRVVILTAGRDCACSVPAPTSRISSACSIMVRAIGFAGWPTR